MQRETVSHGSGLISIELGRNGIGVKTYRAAPAQRDDEEWAISISTADPASRIPAG